MEQTTKVFDMATLIRKDAIILEEFLFRGTQSAIILAEGHYYMASQIDREHGLCYNSHDRDILTIFNEKDSPHLICRVRSWENPYFIPAYYEAGIPYDFITLEEAKQAIKHYSL